MATNQPPDLDIRSLLETVVATVPRHRQYFCDIEAAWFSRHETSGRGVTRISGNEKTARIAQKTTKRLKYYKKFPSVQELVGNLGKLGWS